MNVTFKSIPVNFRKEALGLKNNTIRKEDRPDDIRFELLSNFKCEKITLLQITIENSETHETFVRNVKDVTFWDGYWIISW
jgi:hypothetical protein